MRMGPLRPHPHIPPQLSWGAPSLVFSGAKPQWSVTSMSFPSGISLFQMFSPSQTSWAQVFQPSIQQGPLAQQGHLQVLWSSYYQGQHSPSLFSEIHPRTLDPNQTQTQKIRWQSRSSKHRNHSDRKGNYCDPIGHIYTYGAPLTAPQIGRAHV